MNRTTPWKCGRTEMKGKGFIVKHKTPGKGHGLRGWCSLAVGTLRIIPISCELGGGRGSTCGVHIPARGRDQRHHIPCVPVMQHAVGGDAACGHCTHRAAPPRVRRCRRRCEGRASGGEVELPSAAVATHLRGGREEGADGADGGVVEDEGLGQICVELGSQQVAQLHRSQAVQPVFRNLLRTFVIA